MSGLIVGLVLRLPITDEFNSKAKFIATVYADHAWEDGTHAYPAVDTVVKITGFSKSTVQRYLRILRNLLLTPNGKGPRGTIRYDFPLVENADGSVRLAIRRGVTQTPRQADRGVTESGVTESGVTIMTPEPTTRHFKPKEEEGDEAKKISTELQEALKDLGIYLSVWTEVKKRLLEGWTEADVFAVIGWMRKATKEKSQAAQRFVKRIREGTKAPKEFYPRQQAVAEEAGDDQGGEVGIPSDSTITVQVQKAWRLVLDQLSQDMDRGMFVKYIRDLVPVHFEAGHLQIGTLIGVHQPWLEERFTRSVENYLLGTMNGHVTVEFVVVEAVAMETEA